MAGRKQASVEPRLVSARLWPDGMATSFIDGEWTAGRGGAQVTVDPSTADEIVEVRQASREDVAEAVRMARRAQRAWAALSIEGRMDHLAACARALDEMSGSLALLESLDTGNPVAACRRDMDFARRYLKLWPGYALSHAGRAKTSDAGLSYTRYVPYGVVGRIIAYNHPTLFALAGSIFPLLAGNTMVIKASEQTPLPTLALGHVLGANLPPGCGQHCRRRSGDGRRPGDPPPREASRFHRKPPYGDAGPRTCREHRDGQAPLARTRWQERDDRLCRYEPG